jgi:hypothetical protein
MAGYKKGQRWIVRSVLIVKLAKDMASAKVILGMVNPAKLPTSYTLAKILSRDRS